VAKQVSDTGFHVTGIDMSQGGIQMARINCPQGRFEVLPADQDVLKNLGESPFDLVYSLEVIEHLYDPTSFLDGCFAATSPGGMFICSTPYHGYLKNLALSITNSWDTHANPLNDGGHIRFYSKKTLARSLLNSGFENPTMIGSGRLPYLWKSLIAVTHKPS
jgi:2-polyprenyl-3-methyl-5-hydroxy-6-metoxy-1,4-benzoquinol methylase